MLDFLRFFLYFSIIALGLLVGKLASMLAQFLNLSKTPEKNCLDEAKQLALIPLELLLFKLMFVSTPRGSESFTFAKHYFTNEFIAFYTFSPVFALV